MYPYSSYQSIPPRSWTDSSAGWNRLPLARFGAQHSFQSSFSSQNISPQMIQHIRLPPHLSVFPSTGIAHNSSQYTGEIQKLQSNCQTPVQEQANLQPQKIPSSEVVTFRPMELIREVYHHPIIWDRDDPGQRSSQAKAIAWTTIAAKLGLPVCEARKKWRSIRDTYVRRKRDDANSERIFWPYFRVMRFIDKIPVDESEFNRDPMINVNGESQHQEYVLPGEVDQLPHISILQQRLTNSSENMNSTNEEDDENSGLIPLQQIMHVEEDDEASEDSGVSSNRRSRKRKLITDSNQIPVSVITSSSHRFAAWDHCQAVGAMVCSYLRMMTEKDRAAAEIQILSLCLQHAYTGKNGLCGSASPESGSVQDNGGVSLVETNDNKSFLQPSSAENDERSNSF